ncbi:16S rRNA (guanine(527)-N(7))-methyltransferase RsmG [Terrabacter sp. 2RAF25]|uniref:16S rRNA (guanine(527)-N(7))-methyltransferase RsmG n=1 Tax=Terrabacter sp. 2RAF25 TaxID=3232998 RepID=UPI003F9494A7
MSHDSPGPIEPTQPTQPNEPTGRAGSGGPGSTGQVPPATPEVAGAVFAGQLALAEQFVAILADTGITHGLIGPREAPRLWDRHVLNCAVVHEAIPVTGEVQRVIDVGSGAGLPGLALAIVRPDLELHLVEPLARRTAWLSDTVQRLGLPNVTVHTARAEALWGQLDAPWVTARAVSRIIQLAEWTLPLLTAGGTLLALKGSRAQTELDDNLAALTQLGVVEATVEAFGTDLLSEPTLVLRASIGDVVDRRRFRSRQPSSAGSARRRADRPRGSRRSGPAASGRRRHQP